MDIKLIGRSIGRQLVSGVAVSLLAVGVLGTPQALAGISTTKHNLGSTGTGVNKFSGTGEICVFCHTPHGADTSAVVPLWNRSLGTSGTPATYTTYNSLGTSSLDGATAPVGSVSLACLSCHDGVTAMNSVINQPGSGLTNAGYAGSWSGTNQTAGKMTGVAALGQDLQNDHPIGIQYGGGMSSGTGTAFTKATIPDGGFKDADFKGIRYASLNGNDVWWVDSGTSGGTRDKADMMLYTRTGASIRLMSGTLSGTMSGAQAFVECASCHDPHTDANPTFLRISNVGSAVCLACHIK